MPHPRSKKPKATADNVGREAAADVFRNEHIASTFNWTASPQGQHVELGIAEMNLSILLSALGLSHDINGERLFPIGTIYDPFIARCLDALNYACYQGARFILVGTPSGLTLAPEGGARRSIGTPLIGMAQDGLAAFEPAFVDELAVVLAWGFEHLQRVDADEDGEGGGSVYLRLSTRPVEQITRTMSPELRRDIIAGGYWLRRPGPNCQVVVAYTGAVAAPALKSERQRKNLAQAITWIENPAPPMPKLYPNPLSQSQVEAVAKYIETL